MATERGVRFPPRPELYEDMRPAWEAFRALSQSRSLGMSAPNPITAADIEAYLRLHGITDEETLVEVYDAVRALDVVWCAEVAKKVGRGNAKDRHRRQGR